MKTRGSFRYLCLAVMLTAGTVIASDWPMYRKDARRSAVTDEELSLPLEKSWTYQCAQRPRPAWAPQPKLLNRVDYDYAFQVVVSGGLVYFGSSADDTVRALDLATGRERWHFIAGGPIRFAPQIYEGRAYFASDDGVAYCLDAVTGKKVWVRRVAPWTDRMVGNGRMISRWPCRTGILVADEVAYVTAGLWPSDGIYIYALDAGTGEVKWVNDAGGYVGAGFIDSADGNHQGEFIFRGVIPEGALLLGDGVLIVPQGNVNPARIDAATGRFWTKSAKQGEKGLAKADAIVAKITAKGDRPPVPAQIERAKKTLANRGYGRPGSGGTWVTIDSGMYYVMAMHRNRMTYLNGWTIRDGAPWGNRHTDRAIPQLTKEGLFRSVAPGRVSIVVRNKSIIARNAYDLILSDDAMILGHDGAVSVTDLEKDTELWRAAVRGEARGLAVANGRLIVSTDKGEITCFTSGAGRHTKVRTFIPGPKLALSSDDAALLGRIRSAGMDKGYALVLGDTSGRLSRALAEQTSLHVINALVSRKSVDILREKLLSETSLYGSRLHIQFLADNKKLPLAQYFANAVVVLDKNVTPAREMYRVLRPCGGILLAPDADAVLKRTGAPAAEIVEGSTIPAIIRGQLPGANDFNNRVPDPLVKWPLQPLWFGGPEPDGLADHRSGEIYASAPIAAYGRYFVQGAASASGIDAYNGTVLWTRRMPKAYGEIQQIHGRLRNVSDVAPVAPRTKMRWRQYLLRRLSAVRRGVYVTLGPMYLNDQGQAKIMLNPRTGEQKMFFGPYTRGPQISLEAPRTWVLQIPAADDKIPDNPGDRPAEEQSEFNDLVAGLAPDSGMDVPSEEEGRKRMKAESGMLTMSADKTGLGLRLTTRDPAVTEFDIWELFFDFRPLPERYGLYDRGTFSVRVIPARKGAEPRIVYRDTPHPGVAVDGRMTSGGTLTTVSLAWKEIEKLVGRKPSSFDFAARLYADDTGTDYSKPIRMRQLFGFRRPDGLNAGWATMWLGRVPASVPEPTVVHPMSDLPKGHNLPGALTGRRIDESVRTSKRVHPLTGDVGPKLYRSGSWSCGGPTYSATCVFRRPSKPAIGVYDFEDDSGLRFIGGVSSPCGTSAAAVMGLLIHSDSRFRCDCNPPIKTSVAFAPAERIYNEDWALFYEREVNTRIRHAAVNFGAFGDRRDGSRKMWLAVPRDVDRGYGYALLSSPKYKAVMARDVGSYAKHVPAGLLVPVEVDFDESFGPYRRNSDRVVVEGTERPWLYASGVAGIREITMSLDFLDPLAALAVKESVVPDGRLDEPDWKGPAQVGLADTETEVFLRYDARALYIGARRSALVDRRGNSIDWTQDTSGRDADVWNDDSLEVFLSDSRNEIVVHLGLSASGATYDARSAGENTEDKAWGMPWQSGARADNGAMTLEFAIPLAALVEAGLDTEHLGINVMMNKSDTRGDAHKWLGGEGRNWNQKTPTSEALGRLGTHGRSRCSHFAPLGLGKKPARPERRFAVRLHFAELDPIKPGTRIFDVKIQGRTALTSFDIVKEAGSSRRAVVKGFRGVSAGEKLTIEFVSSKSVLNAATAPIISGFEILEETREP